LDDFADDFVAGRAGVAGLRPLAARCVNAGLADAAKGDLNDDIARAGRADLGVYGLSEQPFSPKDQQHWTQWKRAIVRHDVLLATVVGLALATTDNLQARVSGMVVTLPSLRFRLGWFTDFADFGFKLQPTLHSGLKVKSPDVEFSTALVENFGSGPANEIRALEVVMNNKWLQKFAAPCGWELALTATGRYALATRTPVPQAAVHTAADLYFRRAGFADPAALALLVRSSFATHYRTQFSAASAVGLAHNRYDLGGLVRVGLALDRDAGTRGASIGLVLAASLEPRLVTKGDSPLRLASLAAAQHEMDGLR